MNLSGGKYSRVLMDFDGTIVDSNSMKQLCAKETAEQFGFEDIFAEKFSRDFIQLSGRSRGEKFRKWFGDELAFAMIEYYSNLVEGRLCSQAFISGADRFLEELVTLGVAIYVVSGSRSTEIANFLAVRTRSGLHEFHVCGDEKPKIEWFYELDVGEGDIFFGDSEEDLATAVAVGCRFVCVNSGLVRAEMLSAAKNWILVNDFYDSKITEELDFASCSD